MVGAILSYAGDFLVLVLAVAYAIEWKLGRVQLRQSYADIKLVWKQFRDKLRGAS